MTDKGFTLIEMVVTLTLVSIISAYVLLFASNAYENSVEPVLLVNKMNLVESCMEDVNAAYLGLLNQSGVFTQLDIAITQILANTIYANITATSSFIEFTANAGDPNIMDAGPATAGNNTVRQVTLTYNDDPPVSITALFFALK